MSVQLKTQIPEEMVRLALDNLKIEKLLSNFQEITINFNGLSRREAIRKIGLTMAILPLISTILIPAASAQSLICQVSTPCFCQDASCVRLGDLALLQDPCSDPDCSDSGGNNGRCVGRFFCSATPGIRFGRCGLV